MSQFSRRARWLNQLFTASVAPQSSDPAVVSDDVSLVQPYDGSGWPIPQLGDWFSGPFLSPTGAAADTELIQVADDEVFRLFAISVFTVATLVADAGPIVSQIQGAGGVQIAPNQQSPGLAFGSNVYQFPGGMILPPGSFLRGGHFNGNGTTILSWSVYGCRAPSGTVFYV